MRAKLTLLVVAVLVLGTVYLAGWLPERSRRVAAEGRAAAMQIERDDAHGRLQAARLLGDVLALEEVVKNRNYGQAEQLASTFFDAVRDESSRASDASIGAAMRTIQSRRDVVTAALARTDPAVVDLLHEIEVQLRKGLGYPVP
jgi:hypothetical protein